MTPDVTTALVHAGGWVLASYLYNTSGAQFARDLFPDTHPDYQAEYATTYAESPQRALGKLEVDRLRSKLDALQSHIRSWLYFAALPDGRVVTVIPLTYHRARVTVGTRLDCYDDSW